MGFNYRKLFIRTSVFGTVVGGVVLLKEYVGGGLYDGKETAKDKIVIVTGANSGIGKETAWEMARREAKVILACRDMDKCKIARKEIILDTLNKHVYCRECDLASLESIRKFVQTFKREHDRLDILINNGGVMRCKKSVTKEGFETQLGTNHFGHFLLTMLLLDTIKLSAPARIINVSSVAHQRGKINFSDLNSDQSYDAAEAYNQSKLANMLFTFKLAEKLQGTGVTCNAVHPGLVNTNISRHLSFADSWISAIFIRPFTWLVLKSPRQGAQNTIYAALNKDLEGVTGKYFSNKVETEPSELSRDKEAADRLWAISEKWTRLS